MFFRIANRLAKAVIIFTIAIGLFAPTAIAAPNQQSAGSSSTCKTVGCEDPATKCTKSQCDLIIKYVNPAINLLAAVFGTIAVGSLVMGGIQYTTSEGDPQKASKAKDRITNTILAVFAFLFMYSFLQFLVPGGIFNR